MIKSPSGGASQVSLIFNTITERKKRGGKEKEQRKNHFKHTLTHLLDFLHWEGTRQAIQERIVKLYLSRRCGTTRSQARDF
jgi:hypothetical protein